TTPPGSPRAAATPTPLADGGRQAAPQTPTAPPPAAQGRGTARAPSHRPRRQRPSHTPPRSTTGQPPGSRLITISPPVLLRFHAIASRLPAGFKPDAPGPRLAGTSNP